MLIANIQGLLMAFISLGAAIGVGFEEESAMMMLAGPLLVAMDIAFRMWPRNQVSDRNGGSVCFIPAWLLGLLWLGFGFSYSIGLM